jgi:mannose-6-phosphate isomerase-like protein (cupin superfamily)
VAGIWYIYTTAATVHATDRGSAGMRTEHGVKEKLPGISVGADGFRTKALPSTPDTVAPDGTDVRVLLALAGGSMAHFELGVGMVSVAVAHRSVEEIWYFLSGFGEMWRKNTFLEEVTSVRPGICLTIPLHTHFQFRCIGREPLTAIAVTMPPWPGAEEAFEIDGKWRPAVRQGS